MEKQIYVSILLPAFAVDHESQIDQLIKSTLCLAGQSYEIIQIPSKIGKEFAVKLTSNSINIQDLDKLVHENANLRSSFEKCKESLQTLSAEFDKIVNDPQALQEHDKQKFQKQLKKQKLVKEENKRLRQLLKSQLENSEKQRIETQSTVETLREELDLLIKELSVLQQKKEMPH